MRLTTLDISHLRNVEHAALSPSPCLNLLVGENGSGKTSALEGIHILGRGRSFRTAQSVHLVQFNYKEALITGSIQGPGGPRRHIGVRLARQLREIHLDGRSLPSSVELIQAFPVMVIHPASVSLLEGSPRARRQFLDWGTFHVEHSYLDDWRRYTKALNQRNAALKRGRTADIEPWNQEAARYGTIVAEARDQFLRRLIPYLNDAVSAFFADHAVQIEYARGWKADRDLLDVMREEAAEDFRHGYTRSGPHRGDIALSFDGIPARTYLSRGQTKLLVYALLLAQACLVEGARGSLCVLIDDLASELDRPNRRRLLDLLILRRTQCFVTAVLDDDIPCAMSSETAMFHVEHGRISQHQW